MEVKWEPRAAIALGSVVQYRYDMAGRLSAERLLGEIESSAARLSANPLIGPTMRDMDGLKGHYRSLVTAKIYKLVYRVEPDAVYVAALFDCRRDPARLLDDVTG